MAQDIVNAYCRVTAVSGSTLTVASVLETHALFEEEQQVVLIQMQADVLGNTSNSDSFGDVDAIGTAGLYEILEIESLTRSAGNLVSVELKDPPVNSFTTGSHDRLQLVSFPQIGNPSYTTTQNISCPAWNGDHGGIVAFQVTGTLTLAHTIEADEKGFRGGTKSVDQHATNNCDNSVFISNSSNHGEKGEGIYRNTNSDYTYSRARMINGGGGGSSHNGGGGGGSNFTAGGIGGAGWNGTSSGCSPTTSGLGGMSLASYIDQNRVFAGGGGGGGQQNNTAGTDGANGGGIIFLKADTLVTPSTSCNVRISANGGSVPNAGNDGSGGGGGGGSIVFQVNVFEVNSNCPLTVEANGGNGGSVNSSTHAGGGGGGQGAVVFPYDQPMASITTTTLTGDGGCDNSSCTQGAADGVGPDNIGILTGVPSLLSSVEVDLVAEKEEDAVALYLEVRNTLHNAAVPTRIERSVNTGEWTTVVERYAYPGSRYRDLDHPGNGLWYYRASAIDDGIITLSKTRAVNLRNEGPMVQSYFPNPANDVAYIRLSEPMTGQCHLRSADGRTVQTFDFYEQQELVLEVFHFAPGLYLFELLVDGKREVLRLKIR